MTSGGQGCFQAVAPKLTYEPADRPHDTFLLPLLVRASTYDRAAGFFSSTSLALAADGLEHFTSAGGRIRLLVNHQLAEDDVAAVQRGLELRDLLGPQLEKVSLAAGADGEPGMPARLRLLCTLVALSQLDLKVAVAAERDGTPMPAAAAPGIHHAKFGVLTDRCDPPCQVAFNGSNNESASGWGLNYETFHVYPSWLPDVWRFYGIDTVERFARHWDGPTPQGWAVVELTQAVRDNLIASADPHLARQALEEQGRDDEIEEVVERILAARGDTPGAAEPLSDVAPVLDAPRRLSGVGVGTPTVGPWPHQHDVARKVAGNWPCSRLFSDEVGLGKTIEIGLVLRELLTSGQVERVLLLVPASVVWQWQSELWEKFTLAVPVLDGRRLEWPKHACPGGDKEQRLTGERWDAADVMLASSHLARRGQEQPKLTDRRWDLVVVDEAHHARRRGTKGDEPNALLRLLRRMKAADCWQGVLLATATPMQMHPHEAYDLLALCDLPGPAEGHEGQPSWRDAGADGFEHYYAQLGIEDPEQRDWRHLRALARSHAVAFPGHNPQLAQAVERQAAEGVFSRSTAKKIIDFADTISERPYRRFGPAELAWLDAWLREHTPTRALTHRNTRHLLRAYQDNGLIDTDVVIPRRAVRDMRIDFDAHEQQLYDRIETWIRERYAASQQAAARGDRRAHALGFIMTVYRRRLTSSFAAIELSLQRRRDALAAKQQGLFDLSALLDTDDRAALDDVPDELVSILDTTGAVDSEVAEGLLDATGEELSELDDFLAALRDRPAYDQKLQRLVDDLRFQLGQPKPDGTPRQAIIFTQFTDTMDALRGQLVQLWGDQVACYSGRGGQRYDPDTARWVPVDKGQLKQDFAEDRYRLLLGTDAMSEGLNLQSSDLLYNLDLPWNFMRVEQRIGRADRIGGHPIVTVVNMLISGTVEERIYSGISEDFADFEAIVGSAQPVLSQTEDAIREAALAPGPDRDALLRQQAQDLVDAARDAENAPVNLDTFQPDIERDTWRPAAPLPGETDEGTPWPDRLREALTDHPVLGQRFASRGDGTWTYEDPHGTHWHITFDPKLADASGGAIGLFVWGHPAFPHLQSEASPRDYT